MSCAKNCSGAAESTFWHKNHWRMQEQESCSHRHSQHHSVWWEFWKICTIIELFRLGKTSGIILSINPALPRPLPPRVLTSTHLLNPSRGCEITGTASSQVEAGLLPPRCSQPCPVPVPPLWHHQEPPAPLLLAAAGAAEIKVVNYFSNNQLKKSTWARVSCAKKAEDEAWSANGS